MDIEFIKELYREGWARKEQLASEINLPLGILPIFGGILVFFHRGAAFLSGLASWSFLALFGLSAFWFVATVISLFRAYHGHEYKSLPLPGDLNSHYEGLLKAYREAEPDDPQAAVREADVEFDDFLRDVLIEAADQNAENNDERAAHLYRMRRALLWTVCFTAACALPWSLKSPSLLQSEKAPVVSPNAIQK